MSWPALLARVRPHRRTLVLSGALALLDEAASQQRDDLYAELAATQFTTA